MALKGEQFPTVSPKNDFIVMEKQLLNFWYKSGIIKKYLTKNSKAKNKFSFLDGPITANNPMGVHHAWGRTYKDLWQRFYNMLGFKQRFQNGFDEQGLWVEVEVEKELGLKNKREIENLVKGNTTASIAKFVNLCKKRVKKYSAIQTEQSKRLGYFMDWDNSYHTSSDENNYAIWNFLKVCNDKGYLYKGRDAVPWCPRCGTAISQHEILTEEYKEISHKAVYVKYRIVDKDEYLLVWTTTPWTLPSNVAIAVNPMINYSKVKIDNDLYWIATDLKEKVALRAEEIERSKGNKLVGLKYYGIFDDLPALAGVEHYVVGSSELVTASEGTGLVHISPGAGEEDFRLATVENLPVIESIDESANYLSGFGELTGKNAKENPELIINILKIRHALFKLEDYVHRYPVCWRCKTELVWRVVDEWYIAMDKVDRKLKSGKTLRQQMIEIASKIKWIPDFCLERELDWLRNMKDWLISKKRYWGLALPIWECHKCGNFEVIGSKNELRKKAVSGWSKFVGHSPHRPWVDQIMVKCSKCGEKISRIPDVGNPWLDAGIVPFSTLPKGWFPADFITESFPGQFKNWFYSLIAMSTVLTGKPPFKTVLGFASLLDEKGEEMHKSKGNAIEFNQAADTVGVDVMRWMYLSQNPANNLLFGYQKAGEIKRRFYLILWNTLVFFVTYANLDSWYRPNKISKPKPVNILDKWILSKFAHLVENVTFNLKNYSANSAAALIEEFVVNDLSTWYIRRSRERVGLTSQTGNLDKESFYQTMYWVLVNLSKILAPFLPFVADEIYITLTNSLSVHLTDWPQPERLFMNNSLEKEMEEVRKIATLAHSVRKNNGIKLRQPLPKLSYRAAKRLSAQMEEIIKDEVNVKEIVFDQSQKESVVLDLNLTKELIDEGAARELVRRVQELRKTAGCSLDQKIVIVAPEWPQQFEQFILSQTIASEIIKGKSLKIIKS